ncbi:hypothetical protein [Hymenobacter koreensis]|uniref:hypothetical protein n=1 Tax=Hymenobacter koreensis TaxID=1084523 RepID=UPI0031F193C1
MTILEVGELVADCATPHELEQALESQIQTLSLALLTADVTTPAGLQELEQSFYMLKRSPGFRELEQTEDFSAIVQQVLILFATAFERSGSRAMIKPIRALLPESSVKKRLRAQELIHLVSDARTGFTRAFEQVMRLLHEAQFEQDSEYTSYIILIVREYIQYGVARLTDLGLKREKEAFLALFSQPEQVAQFAFLDHPAVHSLLRGETGGALHIQPAVPKPTLLYPTALIESIFQQHILQAILRDDRTRGYQLPLGYTNDASRERILEYGRADFREPCRQVIPEASPADRVLLYCYYNMRKHFFTTRYVLAKVIDSLQVLLSSSATEPVFVDLGCGPMTSGLAFADLYHERFGKPLTIRYAGIDIAPAMLLKARDFSASPLFAADSKMQYHESWTEALEPIITQLVQVTNPIIINASYLFASSSLNVDDLALFVSTLRQRCRDAKMFFVFQNPNRADRNRKYIEWRSRLPFIHTLEQSVAQVYYKNNAKSGAAPSVEEVYYELLAFQ